MLFRISKKNFRLSLPVLVINSSLPTLLFGLAYLLGTFFCRKNSQESERMKTEQDRIDEIRLIEDKAAENYRYER